ncbi:MAG: cyclase family protein [Motilibacteraceae bacterium]
MSTPGTTSDLRNGPPLTRAEFDEIYDRLRRWGAPAQESGSVDQRGARAGLGPEQVLAALSVPRTGRTVSLALPLNRTAGPDNARPALHHMVDLGDVEAPEPSAHKDFIGLDYHGKAVSHLDALCHIGYRGELYGGVPSREVFSSVGSTWAAVTTLSGGLVQRAVLLDLPVLQGTDWIEPGTALLRADVEDGLTGLGVQLRPGDALLVRTGLVARRAALGAWDTGAASAGLHVDAMSLVAEAGVSLLGGDNDSDVRPSPVEGVHSPIHALALTALGIPLLDNLDLEELSVACREAGRYEFLLVVAPLVVPGGTGSPVNPVAIL